MGPERSDAEKKEHEPSWDRHTDRPSTTRCVNHTHGSERLLHRCRTRHQQCARKSGAAGAFRHPLVALPFYAIVSGADLRAPADKLAAIEPGARTGTASRLEGG